MGERAALITGASGGIGLAITKALAGEGFGVTMAARQPDKLEAAVNELKAQNLDVSACPVDVSQEDQVSAMLKQHEASYGRLDVLVNNAGVGIGGSVEDTKTKHLDMQLNVNLRAPYLVTRESIPMLKRAASESGKSYIINMASIAGKYGQGGLAAYSAAKAGIIALSEALQLELGSAGVATTAICPGFVATAMTEWIKDQVGPEDMIQPDDIAKAVLLLLNVSKNCVIPEIVMKRPGAQL